MGKSREMTMSPIGALVRGAVAGAVGTVCLDAANYAQYRAGGGTDDPLTWEFSAGLDSWDKAPAPAIVGKRLYEGFMQKELPPTTARLMNNVTHWAYGIVWGAQFGLIAGSGLAPRRLRGAKLGTVVWLSGYIILPLAKLYQPLWKYDAKTLAKDWGGHLAYGTGTSLAFRLLGGRSGVPAED